MAIRYAKLQLMKAENPQKDEKEVLDLEKTLARWLDLLIACSYRLLV